MYHFYDVVINDNTGVPLSGVIIRIYTTAGVLVPLFADEAGTTPIEAVSGIPDAAVTDGDGNYDFYIADGKYDMRFFQGDAVLKVLKNIQMVVAASDLDVQGKAQATALGVPGDAANLGVGWAGIVSDNPSAKQAIAEVETGILDRVTFIDGIVANNPSSAAANSAKVQAAFDNAGIVPAGKLARFAFRPDLVGTVHLSESHSKSGVYFDQGQVTLSGGDIFVDQKTRFEGLGRVDLLQNAAANKNQWETFGPFQRVEVSGGGVGYGFRNLYVRQSAITTGADTFDVGSSCQSYHGGNLNGAIALGQWHIDTLAPQTGTSPAYQFGTAELNLVNMDRAPGQSDYLQSWFSIGRKTFGINFTPESRDFSGYQTGKDGYSVISAFIAGRSGAVSPVGGKYAQISAPFMAIEDAVMAGGSAFVAKGATSSTGINGDGIPLAHFIGRNRSVFGIDLTGSIFSGSFAAKFDSGYRVGCDTAYTIYNETSQKGITQFKARDAAVSRRHEMLDVGGAETDTGGAYFRGTWSFGPTYTVSGSPSFPAMVEYAQYDTLTNPTYKRWRRSTPSGHRSQFVVNGSTVWMDYDPDANILDISAPTKLPRYLLSTLPSASVYQDCAILVTNATGGRTICIANGTNWCPSGSTTPVS